MCSGVVGKTRKWSTRLKTVVLWQERIRTTNFFLVNGASNGRSISICLSHKESTRWPVVLIDTSCVWTGKFQVTRQLRIIAHLSTLPSHKIPILPARMNLDNSIECNRANYRRSLNFHYTVDEFVTLLLPPSLDRSWNGWNRSLSFELSLLDVSGSARGQSRFSCKRNWESPPCNLRVKLVQWP